MSEQAILVSSSGEIEEVLIPAEGEEGRLKVLQDAVGGYIERFPTSLAFVYVNEEAWMKGLDMNTTLMALLNARQPILGNAVILSDDIQIPIHKTLKSNLQLLMNEVSKHQFFEEGGE